MSVYGDSYPAPKIVCKVLSCEVCCCCWTEFITWKETWGKSYQTQSFGPILLEKILTKWQQYWWLVHSIYGSRIVLTIPHFVELNILLDVLCKLYCVSCFSNTQQQNLLTEFEHLVIVWKIKNEHSVVEMPFTDYLTRKSRGQFHFHFQTQWLA